MKPLHVNPLQRGETERTKYCRSEINEFIKEGCKYAELWQDEGIRSESMAMVYKTLLLKEGIKNVKIHYSKNHGVIAERTDL